MKAAESGAKLKFKVKRLASKKAFHSFAALAFLLFFFIFRGCLSWLESTLEGKPIIGMSNTISMANFTVRA